MRVNKFILQIAMVIPLSLMSYAVIAIPCEEKELWFEAGIGFYANGYSLEGTEKRIRSLYGTMKGEPLTEEEAVATALQAWRFLDSEKVATNIGQVERVMLAHRYYAQCREKEIANNQEKPGH